MVIGLTRELIAMRVAQELRDGQVVNLGIGLPTQVPHFLPPDLHVWFQAENGILGYGGVLEQDFDQDFINAGGQPVSILPGASFFSSDQSFAMIRGGHVDVAILGGLQVSARGDLANWYVPSRGGGSIGGAMDLAVGARSLIVAMEHTTRDGRPRIVRECDYPLTAARVVSLVITDLGVFQPTGDGFRVVDLAPGVTRDYAQARTGAPLH